jgi:CRISPR/Cas system-associated endoribonuclease Cas2
MAIFLISYDLRKPDFDYKPLYAALDKVEAKHIQDSVWGIDTTSSAEVVYKYLWQHMHSERDRLFVVPFDKTQDYKAINSMTKLSDV